MKFVDVGANMTDPMFRGEYHGKCAHDSDYVRGFRCSSHHPFYCNAVNSLLIQNALFVYCGLCGWVGEWVGEWMIVSVNHAKK